MLALYEATLQPTIVTRIMAAPSGLGQGKVRWALRGQHGSGRFLQPWQGKASLRNGLRGPLRKAHGLSREGGAHPQVQTPRLPENENLLQCGTRGPWTPCPALLTTVARSQENKCDTFRGCLHTRLMLYSTQLSQGQFSS